MSPVIQIKPAHYAGTWYPHSPKQLEALIGSSALELLSGRWSEMLHSDADFFTDVSAEEPEASRGSDEINPTRIPGHANGPLVGGILPHAGLQYSALGQLSVLRHLHWKPELVIILSPSHRVPLSATDIIATPFQGYSTPLGVLAGKAISGHKSQPISIQPDHHISGNEHALELLLPGLASHLGLEIPVAGFIFPAYQAVQTDWPKSIMEWVQHVRQTIISAVAQYADLKKVLWLVSSDFTHYGPRFNYQPYGNLSANPDQIFKKIADQDISIAHSLCELDISAAIQTWQMTRPTICGFIPSLVVSAIMQQLWNGRIQGRVNSYYTSASVMRSSPQVLEDSNAVAYASLAFRLT